jgi:hypothetical protein
LFVAETSRQALRLALLDPERRCGRLKEQACQMHEAGKCSVNRDLIAGLCFDCLHLRSDCNRAGDNAITATNRDIASIFQCEALGGGVIGVTA